jgi:hypothetical protein
MALKQNPSKADCWRDVVFESKCRGFTLQGAKAAGIAAYVFGLKQDALDNAMTNLEYPSLDRMFSGQMIRSRYRTAFMNGYLLAEKRAKANG